MGKPKIAFSVRLSPGAERALRKFAKEEGCSRSSYVNLLIEQQIAARRLKQLATFIDDETRIRDSAS